VCSAVGRAAATEGGVKEEVATEKAAAAAAAAPMVVVVTAVAMREAVEEPVALRWARLAGRKAVVERAVTRAAERAAGMELGSVAELGVGREAGLARRGSSYHTRTHTGQGCYRARSCGRRKSARGIRSYKPRLAVTAGVAAVVVAVAVATATAEEGWRCRLLRSSPVVGAVARWNAPRVCAHCW